MKKGGENNEQANKLGKKLEKVYQDLEFKIIKIKFAPVEERVQEIINFLFF
jgi:predicted ATPase